MRSVFIKIFFAIIFLSLILSLSAPVLALDGDKVVVVLDPGHGGMDGGTDTGIRTEKTYNLLIAGYLRDALEKDGRFEVIMTRDDDAYLKFLPRALFALSSNADLLLSLHCNSNEYSSVSGAEAYVSIVEEFNATDLAEKLLRSISSAVSISYGKVETCPDTGDSLGIYYWNSDRQWDMPGDSSLGIRSDYYSMNTWC